MNFILAEAGMEISLVGHSILESAAGFAAARYDLEEKPSNAQFMQEAQPVLDALLPELEAEGLDISRAKEALSRLEWDSLNNGVNANFWMIKLSHALEGFSRNKKAYETAADRICQRQRLFVDASRHAASARQIQRFSRNREILALLKSYSERYYELGHVTRGGQATIYLVEALAEDGERTGVQYLARKIHGAESVGRFFDYAKALQRLDHPNIVRMHEVTVDNGDFIIVMEIAPGQDLKAHLDHGKPFSSEQIFNFQSRLLETLRYAWRLGIIHRDLKPNKIMLALDRLSGEMEVTLLDFGMAKFKEADSRSSSMGKGTFLYWAPEQFEGGKITEATDIYQMGLVLLDLVRGRMRKDTIMENDPLAEIPEQRVLHADDPAMQKLLNEIEVMCRRDPKKRMQIPEEAADLELAGAEAEVEEIAPASKEPDLALNLYADISAESAMAMIDQRPPRWLYHRGLTGVFGITALALAGIGVLAMTIGPDLGTVDHVVEGLCFGTALLFGTIPFWDKMNKRKPEKILEERAVKTLTHIFETTEDEVLRISAAKALVTISSIDAYDLFHKSLENPKTRRAAIWGLGEIRGGDDLSGLLFKATSFSEEYFLILDSMMRKEPDHAAAYEYLFKNEEDVSLYERLTYKEVSSAMLRSLSKTGFFEFSPELHPEFYKRLALLAVITGKSGEPISLSPLTALFLGHVLEGSHKMTAVGEAVLQAIQSVGGSVARRYLHQLETRAKETQNKFWQEKIRRALESVS